MTSIAAAQPFIDAVLAEHRAIRGLLDSADRIASHALATRQLDVPGLRTILLALEAQVALHELRESRLLFPKLKVRCPPLGAVLERMEVQHAQMDGELCALMTSLAGDAAGFAAEWRRFASTAAGHMSVEERYIVPVAADFLTPQDWDEIRASVSRQPS